MPVYDIDLVEFLPGVKPTSEQSAKRELLLELLERLEDEIRDLEGLAEECRLELVGIP